MAGCGGGCRSSSPRLPSCWRLPGAPATSSSATEAHDQQDQNRAITAVLGAADADTKALNLPGGGTVRLVTSTSRDAAVVVANQLPALADGKVYQVWLIKSTEAESQGTFARSGAMVMKDLADVDQVAVTVEPSGGSKKPTTAPVVDVPV